MLEHHPDAKRSCAGRIIDTDDAIVPSDLACIGSQHSVNHFYESAFAGAIFPQQRVDLPGNDAEVYIVIRDAAWKGFSNAD